MEGETDDSTTARETALRLLEETEVCTLATASRDGRPEAATVRFVCDETLTLYVNSGSTYRKYRNIEENPRVAVVVDGRKKNLQLEGTATEIDGDAAERAKQRYVEKYGRSQYLTNDESVMFEIEPEWARLLVDGNFPPAYEMVIGEGDTDPHDAFDTEE
ncbi:MAG: pyridoxamine 5'-phosphate oxidase family protein [Natronomonas sp.]